jgi:HTH-type transcriptional regulator / antitoxin HigA
MDIKPIRTESDYRKALERLNQIFDATSGSSESDEADILAVLIDEYEKKQYPIDAPDPIEAIKIRMAEMHYRQVDIADVFGGRNRASEILNRKRKLTIEMIRNITTRLNISPSVLIGDYKISE